MCITVSLESTFCFTPPALSYSFSFTLFSSLPCRFIFSTFSSSTMPSVTRSSYRKPFSTHRTAVMDSGLLNISFSEPIFNVFNALPYGIIISSAESRGIAITFARSRRVFPPYIRQKWTDPDLMQRDYVRKETHRNIWSLIACVAPPSGECTSFSLLIKSPERSTPPNEKDRRFWHWMT